MNMLISLLYLEIFGNTIIGNMILSPAKFASYQVNNEVSKILLIFPSQ